MSLPEFFFDRVTQDILRQIDGVAALAERLSRQRLPADAEACVAGVLEGAGGMRQTLERALDLRLLAAGGLDLKPAPLRLRDLADAVQARWQTRAAQAGVILLVSYDGAPDAEALADRDRLLQTFDGLIGEALAAAGRGAVEATLRAASSPAGVVLEGRVRGARSALWSEQDVEARVRGIEARFGLEVALGAMLARRIVADMGGRVSRETSPGAAETMVFRLELPAAAAAEAPAPALAGRAAHVLVVDDNATNRMVAQALVEMFDCTSESAEDGQQAVDAVRQGQFDLILMDIKMPTMDGVTAARLIRGLPGPARSTPIIALTANADPEDAQAYLAAGMNGVVEKPMKPETLLAALQAALERPADAA